MEGRAPARGRRLPAQPTQTIGRKRELAAIRRQLAHAGVRLLTLIGPGGSGKTRLAIEAAAQLAELFRDGVCFVSLGAVDDPALISSSIVEVLWLRQGGEQSPLALLQDFLADQQLLLVLDNCEHLAAGTPQVAGLLSTCPELKVLATSREPLHLRGEKLLRVPPLALPDAAAEQGGVEQLARCEAVELFVRRAQDARPDFELTSANAAAIVAITRRLDGLPLAIELAAARAGILPPHSILDRLDESLQLLVGGARDLPHRQQTLRDTMAWSYNLLAPSEQRFFRRLAVFAGGFTIETVAGYRLKVEGSPSVQPSTFNVQPSTLAQPSTLELLQSLVDKSLLVPMEQDGEPRFHMLRTIRDYALEQLVAVGEDTLAERAHALSFAHLVEAAEPMLMSGARQPHLARLALEHDNIRAALDWSLSARGDLELGLRMGGALLWFWYFAGHLSEGRDRLERLASRGRAAGLVSATAKVLYGAGALAWVQGDYATALARLKESVGLYEQAGDRHGLAYPLTYVGMVAQFQGDHATACEPLRESVRLFREAGDEWGLALALNHQGYAARFAGDLELAASICEESLALFRQLGDDWSATLPLINYGLLAVAQCDFKAARACLSEAVALRRQLGDKWGTAWALSHLAAAFQGEGRHAQALPLYEESLGLYRDVGSRRGMASCLLGLAHASRAQRRFDRAARLLGMGEALLASVGAALPPQVSDRPALEELVATLRRRLGEQGLRDAWAAGRAAPVTDSQVWLSAAAGVDASTPPMRQPPTAAPATNDPYPAGLTAREVEVLRLLSTGMTNAQIAARLVLSTLTVNVHLRTIYGKLGVSSRTAAARFAIDRNLV